MKIIHPMERTPCRKMLVVKLFLSFKINIWSHRCHKMEYDIFKIMLFMTVDKTNA